MPIRKLLRKIGLPDGEMVFGHSRLVTNGTVDNQPVVRDGVIVIHNGIVVNHQELWMETDRERELKIDTEIICALAVNHLDKGGAVETLADYVVSRVVGVAAVALAMPRLGKLVLFANNGSLYVGRKNGGAASRPRAMPLTSSMPTTSIRSRNRWFSTYRNLTTLSRLKNGRIEPWISCRI